MVLQWRVREYLSVINTNAKRRTNNKRNEGISIWSKAKILYINRKGEEALDEFMDRWEAMQSSVERLLVGKGEKIMLSREARKFLLDMRLF